ncbi:uncharacterized protein EDB91DRAFT_898181 [Suillus paluster]|uniref:uncharacterized protein n=1 Tax=Suillus paluster TaxID=48578 RepID=UPI001B8662A4|nr:uncharacterized protein EDB91DRAFT_898181 [Suillus paluster]KAG1727086.1 hypothetical protein EDB91DRAFT_898181 [Suillus paluster]
MFGVFGVHLPVIYGETKQKALGRLLQAIIAQSGDITALDWVGKASEFNSCLPADIASYNLPPYMSPSLSEDQIQMSVSLLRDPAIVQLALTLCDALSRLSAPRFADCRLHLPCIAFPVTELKWKHGQDSQKCFTYTVKAHGLNDLSITTEDHLIQLSRASSSRQPFLFVRPWNRYDIELPDSADKTQSMENWQEPESPSDDQSIWSPGDNEPADSESHSRELRLIVRLGQPFSALLLAQQRGGEYKRIASDSNIIAQVKDMASVRDMMDVRTLEIL